MADATKQLWTNDTDGVTLAASLAAGAVSMQVSDGSKLANPTGGQFQALTIDNGANREIVYMTERTGDACSIVREQEGTTSPSLFVAGAKVEGRLTAGTLVDMVAVAGAAGPTGPMGPTGPAGPAGSGGSSDGCLVWDFNATSLEDGESTALSFDNEYFDSSGMHSTSSNKTRLVAKTTGMHMAWGQVSFDANAAGYRQLAIKKGGAAAEIYNRVNSFGASLETYVQVSGLIYMNADEYIELYAKQNSGGSLAVNPYTLVPQFGMYLVAAL